MSAKFQKEERLCSKKLMDNMFIGGNSSVHYPFKLVWKRVEIQLPSPAQAAFSVPKRLFKRAHDRNRIKRMMREAYRLCKSDLYNTLNQENVTITVMFIYLHKEELPYQKIAAGISKAVEKIGNDLLNRSVVINNDQDSE